MTPTNNKLNWLPLLAGLVLIVSFFLPWVSWAGIPIAGSDMPGGGFFKTSETKFGLENPFPQLSFAFAAFWLVPVLEFAYPFAFSRGIISFTCSCLFSF
jgi:hypothetical protein